VEEMHRAPQGKEGALHQKRDAVRPVKASDRSAGRVERLRAAARNAQKWGCQRMTPQRGSYPQGERAVGLAVPRQGRGYEGLTCPSTASMVRGSGAAQEGQRSAKVSSLGEEAGFMLVSTRKDAKLGIVSNDLELAPSEGKGSHPISRERGLISSFRGVSRLTPKPFKRDSESFERFGHTHTRAKHAGAMQEE
jgi:hypothetical protein